MPINHGSSMRGSWDAADLAKYGLSIAVVAIHTNLLGPYTRSAFPVLRLAVPLFFMISSVLFFDRLENDGHTVSWLEARPRLRKYIARTAKLYLFWFVVLLIPTAYVREWYLMSPPELLMSIAFNLIFGSTFLASWYLSASVVAVTSITVLRYKLRVRLSVIAGVGALMYVVCLLTLPYRWLFGDSVSVEIQGLISSVGVGPYNSCPVAFFWMSVGLLAVHLKSHFEKTGGKTALIIMGAIGIILMFAERDIICSIDSDLYSTDVYLFLPFAAIPLFLLLVCCKGSIGADRALALRRSSTVIYCLHDTLFGCLKFIFSLATWFSCPDFLRAIITIIICQLVSACLFRLSRLPKLGWLRFGW